MEKIQAPEAWYITQGCHSVKVGVADTGIDHTHPYLQDNVDLSLAVNLPHTNRDAMDYDGRGTQVAGIIGAKDGNTESVHTGIYSGN